MSGMTGFAGSGARGPAGAAGAAGAMGPSGNSEVRLTISAASSTAKGSGATVYAIAHRGVYARGYSGGVWAAVYTAGQSVAMGAKADGNYAIAMKPDGTLAAFAWASGTTYPATQSDQDGVPAIITGGVTYTLLGHVRVEGGVVYDTDAKGYVFNLYNKVLRSQVGADTTATWGTTLGTPEPIDAGNAEWKREFLVGAVEDVWEAEIVAVAKANPAVLFVGIGLDSTTVVSADSDNAPSEGTFYHVYRARYSGRPSLGLHYLQGLMTSGSATFLGDPGYCRMRVLSWR